MFDIGWSELLVVGVIVLFAFGPEDIPKVMYNFGRIMRRFRYMRYALSSQFEDFMEKAEASARSKPAPSAPPQPLEKQTHVQTVMDDESDADEYLMDLMPVPDNVPDRPVQLPPEPLPDTQDDRPEPVRRTADRG